ncbi:ras-related C3 botulinum toxin substrate 1-like isoform X2 [Dendronephthya gigantea]|uniref:ras-related C3 botulinum toxin substrate 1-like isoform X2 n=1 Tax=Dendronephthya gigantea TaxID=151771 RepID=UPI00106CA684|nr:ras-related C3 botulinum toxin substrate 1-like isoform X2 [Dendronephthya gigantea]
MVGKTSLVMTYTEDVFPGEYIPYVVDTCVINKMIDGKPFTFELWDTPAQDGYDRLRPTCYKDTDVFFVCFSIAEPVSLESVTEKWYPEVSLHAPSTPIFLVGTKLDLRNDEKTLEILKSRDVSPVTTAQGLETMKTIGACKYIECSSLTRENLEHLFHEVTRFVLDAAKRKKRKCVVM